MKNIYPDQLIQPASQASLNDRGIRVGDRVTLVLAHGRQPVTCTVDMAIDLFGCTTYTSDARLNDCATPGRSRAMRLRFRQQDIHHLEHASKTLELQQAAVR